jgi:hypothetical protein
MDDGVHLGIGLRSFLIIGFEMPGRLLKCGLVVDLCDPPVLAQHAFQKKRKDMILSDSKLLEFVEFIIFHISL